MITTFRRSTVVPPTLKIQTILWRIDPLLGKGLETNNETAAVAMQRHGKHASTTRELPLNTVFAAWSVSKSYLEENWVDPVNCQLRHEICAGALKTEPERVKLKNLQR
jgi:hypothetical protein